MAMTIDDLIDRMSKVESLCAQIPNVDRGINDLRAGLPAFLRDQRYELNSLRLEIAQAKEERDRLKVEVKQLRELHDQIVASEKVMNGRIDQIRQMAARAVAGVVSGR
jgi:uncharacterized coiled-coil DUF342 family protein